MKAPVLDKMVEDRIMLLRGRRILLDKDLAALYGVKPIALRQQVRRNQNRFPPDFLFILNSSEVKALASRPEFSGRMLGGASPWAFTQEGVSMLSSVLRSPRAVEVNITIMRAFVRMNALATVHEELKRRIDELEARFEGRFRVVFDALRALTAGPRKERRRIGFIP